ncbi:ATP-binding protein [Caldimonas tepidiphila]|uniref:ATP-binding protein n=1 Tax=Caldimonas tepidiphila TaxID=2315841 RepID=UPI001F0C1662|nr:ATP-binding protein [Caldimonas tepidiphila]
MNGKLHIPPRAGAMVEALRGLGYTPATALADIIDNSIAAGARQVDLRFCWAGPDSWISILDDGCGMSREDLVKAMRLGERSPLETRAASDLGRFGLGLKTASFSQARRLTVSTRRKRRASCMRWDLDVLAGASDDGWYLLEGPHTGSEDRLAALADIEQGTLVLWECMDRIVGAGFREQDFLDLIDQIERHLAMVFHRFLEGPAPRLRLSVNGRGVQGWDPFLVNHPATWSSPETRLPPPNGAVTVQCHVLPHKDRLTPALHDSAAGPEGWTSQQGFYVYRNNRMLLAGGWLGLGRGRAWTKEEAHRLARIRLDITNAADSDWKIDIRKSTARPPVTLRDHLTLLAEDTRERARRVFAHRGQVQVRPGEQPVTQAWKAEHFKGGMRYRIDTTHPAVSAVLEQAGTLAPEIRAMLRVVEETIPVQRIWLDTAESRETPRTGFAETPSAEVTDLLRVMYRNLVIRKGVDPALARQRLRQTEPFNNFPQLIDALPDHP